MGRPRLTQLPVRFIRRLGAGHFGVVHLAEVRPHGEVAVKVLERPPGCSPAEWPKRRDELLMEADRLADAEHPNIVRVHGCCYDDKRDAVYIYTEHCEGGSVDSRIAKGPMSVEAFRPILLDVLMGLEALHGAGLVHRDIKPGNILIDAEGRARLSDFGLVSKLLASGYASEAGYIAHLAPEVFKNGYTTPRTDIWALGMTVYRVVNGEPWWQQCLRDEGVDPADEPALLQHVEEAITAGGFAHRLRWMAHVPRDWRRFVRAAMHDDPASRLGDATEALRFANRLATDPSWDCAFSPGDISWSRARPNSRQDIVNWTKGPGQPHNVVALTRPVRPGTGRVLTRYRGKYSSKVKAQRQLEALLLG